MEAASGNFAFLNGTAPRLARLGALAERYFVDDAATALVKLRQLGEFLAKDMAGPPRAPAVHWRELRRRAPCAAGRRSPKFVEHTCF